MSGPSQDLPAEIGSIVGSYRLSAVIGRGGMGTVFRGKHVRLGREVAVKVLASQLSADAGYVSRFFHEARVVNEIRHPNIIDIIDFVEQDQPRIVAYIMELLDGASLRGVLDRGPLSVAQALNATLQLASALEAVHSVGVVHRDLKPDNVFVIAPPGSDLSVVPSVKILDFGIAKISDPQAAHRTSTGAIIGTPGYMAPEQITGEAVSAATDVYALGEILYEMLSGKRIFAGPSPSAILRSKLIGEAPPLKLPAGTPFSIEILELVQACLALEPAQRPTLSQLRGAIIGYAANGLPESRPRSPAPAQRSHAQSGGLQQAITPSAFARTSGPQRAPSLDPTPVSLLQSAVLDPSIAADPSGGRDRRLIYGAVFLTVAMLVAVATVLFVDRAQEPTVISIETPELEPPPAAAVVPAVEVPEAKEEPKAEPVPEVAAEPEPVKKNAEPVKNTEPVKKKAEPVKKAAAKRAKKTEDEAVPAKGSGEILRKSEVPEW